MDALSTKEDIRFALLMKEADRNDKISRASIISKLRGKKVCLNAVTGNPESLSCTNTPTLWNKKQ